jgi:predicted PurR-regulated permease PerM
MVKNQQRIEQIAGIAFIGAIVLGCGLVLRPFVSAILWAAILCFATWPLHELFLRWLGGRRNLTAALMTAVLSLVLIIPFVIVGLTFTDSVRSAIAWVDSQQQAGGLPAPPKWVQRIPMVGQKIDETWSELAADAGTTIAKWAPRLREAGLWLLRHSLDLAAGVVQLVMSVLIAFFLYRDGAGLVARLSEGVRRISGDYAQHLIEVVKTTVQSVVYGVLGTGLAQGIVAAIGFEVAGVPSAMLLALVTFFLSFIPFGPPIIWIGASIWLFTQGRIGWGIFMAIYGLLGISSVDNLIKPFIISRSSRLPFIVMFIGVLGGVAAFGFIGIFLGPTLLAVGFSLAQEILGQRRHSAARKSVSDRDKRTAPAAAPSTAPRTARLDSDSEGS